MKHTRKVFMKKDRFSRGVELLCLCNTQEGSENSTHLREENLENDRRT